MGDWLGSHDTSEAPSLVAVAVAGSSVAGSSGQNRKECPASRSERKEARKPASKGGRAESLHAC